MPLGMAPYNAENQNYSAHGFEASLSPCTSRWMMTMLLPRMTRNLRHLKSQLETPRAAIRTTSSKRACAWQLLWMLVSGSRACGLVLWGFKTSGRDVAYALCKSKTM